MTTIDDLSLGEALEQISPTTRPTGNIDDADYAAFRARVARRFFERTANAGALFTTDADVWTAYIEAFPEGPVRQHHNCHTCRHFLQQYGGLAMIDENGEVSSALWSAEDADLMHFAAVAAMERAVRRAKVTGVFLTSEEQLGRAVTGARGVPAVWAHLAVTSPTFVRHHRRDITAHQATAEKAQDFANVSRALREYSVELLRQVVDLLKADAVYRAEKVLGPAQWLLDLAEAVGKPVNTRRADRLIWRAVATAPAGFCHPRSSMIGTLLDDLSGGTPFDDAARRFAAKMNPTVYQRPQAAPTAGAIRAAENLVAKLGIAPSLRRRFARLEEVEALWRPAVRATDVAPGVFGHLTPKPAVRATDVAPGVFGHLTPKTATAPVRLTVTHGDITWSRFSRDVLPDAKSIELHVPSHGNFCALVTAEDPAAPPILQWDREDRRNPVSWYVYASGSMARRWCLTAGAWAQVDAVTLSPWMWSAPADTAAHHARGALFIIHGAKDPQHQGGALFLEILRSELHGARSVIESYSQSAMLGGAAEASACGLMISDGRTEAIKVRVTTAGGTRVEYRIDRWD